MIPKSIFKKNAWWTHIGFQGFAIFLCYWLLDKLGLKMKIRRFPIKFKNFKYPFYARFGSSDIGVFNQIFAEKEYQCLSDVKDPRLIVDCGANVGYSSLWYLNHYPRAKLIGIEPEEGNFNLCIMNLAPYSGRVSLIQAGVWPHESGLTIERGAGAEWAFQVRESRAGEKPDLVGVNILSILKKSGSTAIDILKIDIESAEKAVFSTGYERWLNHVKNIVIELHGSDCDEVFFKAMSAYDYDLSRSGELTICKNIAPKVMAAA